MRKMLKTMMIAISYHQTLILTLKLNIQIAFWKGPSRQVKVHQVATKMITLVDKKEIREQLQKLDPDQRYVIDEQIRYARFLKLARKGYCKFPTPPLMVVEGDAGSGKSELIKVLCQVMEHEFREGGDDPDQPYILKGAFTGEAATNITGQTLHNMFRLNFGNRLFKLSDKSKDKTRDELKNFIP